MSNGSDYLLGMEPAEVARLERQHAAWHGQTHRVWELAGFGAGQTLVDLGSGPGFAAVELAQLVQDIVSKGEHESNACLAILRDFAAYLQSRPHRSFEQELSF